MITTVRRLITLSCSQEAYGDPAIPLLGIYSDKTLIPKDTCTPMFIVALFTVDYYSAIKKNKIMPFVATWMDLGLSY